MFRKLTPRVLAIAAAVVLVLAGCAPANNTPDPNHFDNPNNCTPVIAAVSSEKVNLFTELAKQFESSPQAQKLAKCAIVVPIDVASGEATRLLKMNWPEDQTDKPKPVIWSPASTSWVAQVADNAGEALVPDPQSFARTPVVIAMPERMAATLGWPNKEIGLKDLHDLCLDPQGWGKFGGAQALWGSFKFGKTNPTTSTTGLNTLLMQSYAATNKTSKLTPADVTAAKQFSQELESCVIHYGDTTGNVLNRVYDRDTNGQSLDYVSALFVEETSVINYNLGNPTSRVVKPGEVLTPPKEKLVAIYPSGGSLESDNPITVLGTPATWVTPEQRTAGEKFKEFLQTPAAQTVLGQFGFRPLDTAASPGGLFTANNGVNPALPKVLLEKPSVETISAAVSQWNVIRKPSTFDFLIDGSGSMNDPAGTGQSMIREALNGAKATLEHVRPSDEMGLSVFSGNINNSVAIIRPVTPLGSDSEELARELDNITAGGGTPLYDALAQSYDAMKQRAQSGRINAIIILSDGDDSGSKVDLDTLLRTIKGDAEQVNDAPVRIFPVIYGSKAPPVVLQRLAEASGGQVFSATDTKRISLVLKQVMNTF